MNIVKQILDRAIDEFNQKDVVEIKIDVKLSDLLKTDKEVTIHDLDDQVWTDDVSVVVNKDGSMKLILPFTTSGNHEWREDIAKEMYGV